MSPAFDVGVIGSGPAGAAAALAAARAGLTVGLFEPQALPDKPCGEGILPSGVAALKELGLEDLLARGRALERIRYVLASGRVLEIPFPVAGCALERPVLARALVRALEREARVTRLPHRVSSRRDGQGFRLQNGQESWFARTLIAADGLQGKAASWLRGPRRSPRRFGLRARARARFPLEHVEVHLGLASEVYLTPLAEDRINVSVLRRALPPGERSSAVWLAAALEEHPGAARALGEWITPSESRALLSVRPRRVAEAGAFLAGDAAGGVDPVLGCGVAIALSTGLAAARAARQALARGSGAPERDYARFVARETVVRRGLADGLVFLAAHPRLQEGVARLIESRPSSAARLAEWVAGSSAARVDRRRPDRRIEECPARSSPAPCPTPTARSTSGN